MLCSYDIRHGINVATSMSLLKLRLKRVVIIPKKNALNHTHTTANIPIKLILIIMNEIDIKIPLHAVATII